MIYSNLIELSSVFGWAVKGISRIPKSDNLLRSILLCEVQIMKRGGLVTLSLGGEGFTAEVKCAFSGRDIAKMDFHNKRSGVII